MAALFTTRRRVRHLPRRAGFGYRADEPAGSRRPPREKLTHFWHDHFATAIHKVGRPELLRRDEIGAACRSRGGAHWRERGAWRTIIDYCVSGA